MSPERFSISPHVAWRIVDEQVFAVTGDGRLHHVASPVGVLVWRKLDSGVGGRDELLAAVLAEFAVARTTAQKDLDEFLADLQGKKVIELSSKPSPLPAR
jgi:hypothetical protein